MATTFSLIYLVLLMWASPYKLVFDNVSAMTTSLMLTAFFLCCIALKVAAGPQTGMRSRSAPQLCDACTRARSVL